MRYIFWAGKINKVAENEGKKTFFSGTKIKFNPVSRSRQRTGIFWDAAIAQRIRLRLPSWVQIQSKPSKLFFIYSQNCAIFVL